MAKILYGVSGEGSGHSSRARLISSHLLAQGHELKLVSYDCGYRNLKNDFDVLEIVGLNIVSVDNEVSVLQTITSNIQKIPDGARALKILRQAIKSFQPDCVISDFEPCTAYLAAHYSLPLISLDNQHRMRYMHCDYPEKLKHDARITETVIRAMVPRPWISLITTFHYGALKNQRSFLFPPILRQAIVDLVPRKGDHILVYLTSGFESLIRMLQAFPREKFIVYGGKKGVVDPQAQSSHITFRDFSPTTFPDDLASAKAVMATAGFTLISEALHLSKPYLAFPMQGQFEQCLNGLMLEAQGYGAQCSEPKPEAIGSFLYRLPDYEEKLLDYPRLGNGQILEKLDELLDNNLQKLYQFKR